MLRLRRRIAGFLTISALAVIAALAATTFGFSPAQAHTTTAVLFPNGQGADTAWSSDEGAIDETGTPSCGTGEFVGSSADGARESVIISLADVPTDATITSVDVQAWHRGESSTGGTFQTYAKLDGSNTDSGTNIATTSSSGSGCQGPATQTINVADTVKSGSTALEVGVRKTGTTGVRVGALRASVTYNTGPSAPTLSSPADAATTQDRTPTFDWNEDSVDPNDGTGGPTGVLIPTANGFYTDWGGEFDRIDEVGTPSCSSSDYLDADTTGRRDSFPVSLTGIPNGATITSVEVQSFHRGDGTAGGTFQTFTRLNSADLDSGVNIATVGTADGPCTASPQTLNVPDTVKAVGTTLQIGVLKTAANTNKVRMGALRAVVNYSAPPSTETPFTYEIARAPVVASACDWDNGTIDAVSSSTFTPGSNMTFGEHCWRVRALDHAGLAGPWSTHRTLTIEPVNVTAEITAADKAYDGTTDAGYTCDVVGEDGGDDVTCDGTHPATFDSASAGTGKTVTATGLTLGGADAGDYNLTNTTDTDTADITKKMLSVDGDDQSKDYGDLDPTFTYTLSGFVAGEDALNAGITGAGDCDREAGESVAGSPYTITCTPDTLAADNYEFETGETGELTINKADPNCSITGFTGTYDGDPHGATGSCAGVDDEGPLAGLDLGDSFTNVPGGTANWTFTDTTGNYDDDAGSVEIVINKADPNCAIDGFTGSYDGDPHGATGSCDGVNGEGPLAGLDLGDTFTNVPGGTANWTFTDETGNYDDDSSAVSIVINAVTLSVDADDQSKDYGDDDPTFTYTLGGFVNGEDESSANVTGEASCTRDPGETVAGSPYTITCTPGDLDADNYTFQTGATGTLTIGLGDVTAEITADDKAYDGDADADYTCEVVGAESGDDVTCDGDHPASFDDANAGNGKTVTATGLILTGVDSGNYNLTNTTDTDEADITKVTLSVDANNASKDYGDDDPTFTYTLTGFVNGETAMTAAGLTGSANCTRDPGETVAGSPYTITCTPDTLAADNYTFETGAAGQLTINRADPNCTITAFSGTYDGDPHGATGSCAGVDGEGPLAGLDLGDTFTNVPGGTAEWTFTDGTGNYNDDSDSVAVVILTASLSVDADGQTKDFGDADPTLTYTLSGFVNGEDADIAGVTGDADCSRALGESVAGSPYTITCDPGTLDADNYTFQTGATGNLTIEAADVTAAITATDKDYDGSTDAEYTCEVLGADPGDDVACDGTHPGSFDDANVGVDKTVTASDLVLSGDDAGNYNLTNTTDTDSADITKATLAIDADDKSKDVGDADPAFTYTLSGFVAGEDETSAGVTGTAGCSRAPGETVAGSPYTITCTPGTLDADNYEFETGATGELTINPDTSVPSVTINQASAQDDPTSTSPIEFDVVFSEPVTGFEDSDVDLSGTAGATTASVSGSGAEYTVSVTGMSGVGTVIATVKAGAATDGTNDSVASTSTDNTVTFDDTVGSLPPKHLDMETKSKTYAGSEIKVTIKRLAPGEEYTIKIDDEVVKTGTANSEGKVKTKVTVPLSLDPGTYEIQAIGSQPDREDTDELRLRTPSDLDVELKGSVTAGDTQRVSVEDLLRGEKVEVRYDGTLISPSDAVGGDKGKYTLTFPVGSTVGTHTIQVTGDYDGRSTTKTFKVKGAT